MAKAKNFVKYNTQEIQCYKIMTLFKSATWPFKLRYLGSYLEVLCGYMLRGHRTFPAWRSYKLTNKLTNSVTSKSIVWLNIRNSFCIFFSLIINGILVTICLYKLNCCFIIFNNLNKLVILISNVHINSLYILL